MNANPNPAPAPGATTTAVPSPEPNGTVSVYLIVKDHGFVAAYIADDHEQVVLARRHAAAVRGVLVPVHHAIDYRGERR